MKILLANKFYYQRGGDCIYTIELETLLKENGHEVAVFAMDHPNNISTPYKKYFPSEVSFSGIENKVKFLLRPFGTKEVKNNFQILIDKFKPDIVHLNNIHSQLSPILAEVAYKKGIKVIWTLHDYKLLCPRYDCLRNGKAICELCFKYKTSVIKNRCMKNSLLASIIAYEESKKWNREKLEKYVYAFICPSSFMKIKMQQGGFDERKLHVLNNFITKGKIESITHKKEDYYCYLGRLSHEKGVKTLIEASKDLKNKLKIIGTGPLEEELKRISVNNTNIEFLGYKDWNEIKIIVGKARFVVVPSEWYENNPFSVIESLCLGTPVLGANIAGIPDLIEDTKNGLLFEPKNTEDLKKKITSMNQLIFNYIQIRLDAINRYSPEKYYKELLTIYN